MSQLSLLGMDLVGRWVSAMGIAFQSCCSTAISRSLCWSLLQHGNQLRLVLGTAAARQSAAVAVGAYCSTAIRLQHGNQMQLVSGPAAARQSAAVGVGACCSTTIICSWCWGLLQHGNQLQLALGLAAARQSGCSTAISCGCCWSLIAAARQSSCSTAISCS